MPAGSSASWWSLFYEFRQPRQSHWQFLFMLKKMTIILPHLPWSPTPTPLPTLCMMFDAQEDALGKLPFRLLWIQPSRRLSLCRELKGRKEKATDRTFPSYTPPYSLFWLYHACRCYGLPEYQECTCPVAWPHILCASSSHQSPMQSPLLAISSETTTSFCCSWSLGVSLSLPGSLHQPWALEVFPCALSMGKDISFWKPH